MLINNNKAMNQKENQEVVTLGELIQYCVKLAQEATKITGQCYQNTDVRKYNKGPNDPVTEADWKIQTMISRSLSKKWRNLRIVGEQDTEFKGVLCTEY